MQLGDGTTGFRGNIRVQLGLAGAFVALLAASCSARVSERPSAFLRAQMPDAVLAAPAAPTGPADVSDVVVPAPALAAHPSPSPSRSARVPQQPRVLPDDSTPARPIVHHGGPEALGQIEIQRIGLSVAFYEGVDQGTLAHGPGHWPGRAAPGHVGNVVLAGHRVTHTHPFRDIDLIQPGDLITFFTAEGRFVYQMTEAQIVRPTDMWIADQTDSPTVTLFACHPKGSASHRYVVRGRLISTPVYDRTTATSAGEPAPPQGEPPPSDSSAPPPRRCTHLLCIGG